MSFLPSHALYSNTSHTPKIVITMPSGLTLSSTCTIQNVIGFSNPTCTANVTGKIYTLTGLTNYTPSSIPISFDIGTITNGLVSGT